MARQLISSPLAPEERLAELLSGVKIEQMPQAWLDVAEDFIRANSVAIRRGSGSNAAWSSVVRTLAQLLSRNGDPPTAWFRVAEDVLQRMRDGTDTP